MSGSQQPIRVMHLTAGSDAGGVSRYIFDLCQALVDLGHEPVVSGEKGVWHDLFEGAPWPWIEARLNGGPMALWRARRRLLEHLRSHRVDVLHCHYRRACVVARGLGSAFGVPVLFTLHLSDIPMRGIWRWLSDFGDHTHAACEESRRWLIEQAKVADEQIRVIPHGVDVRRFRWADDQDRSEARRELGLGEDDLVAAYVGRFDEPKNEQWIIDVAVEARPRVAGLKVLLVGEGPREADLRQRIASEGLDGVVTVLGWRDPLVVYRAIDALLLPSKREGFSLVSAEAMCVGRPVLRTKTAGTSAQIVEGVTGRSVPIDHGAFVKAAVEFLADKPALRQMGHEAGAHVRRHLTFDQQVKRTVQLYRDLVDASRRVNA